MRIARLRERHSPELLAEIYKEPHNHLRFEDHHLRVNATVALAAWLMRDKEDYSVADLSCGNSELVNRLDDPFYGMNINKTYLGDFAPGYEIQGPIEETINNIPRVDLFILSETIEHVDDPHLVLTNIRDKADRLVLSTPIDEKFEDDNREHYWAWDVEGMEYMLKRAKWEPVTKLELSFNDWFFPYNFQIWGCR